LESLSIHAFGAATAAALLAGYEITAWRARAVGLDAPACARYYLIAILAGLAGGHIAYELDHASGANAVDWIAFWRGQSVVGLVIAEALAMSGLYLLLRRNSAQPWRVLDTLAFSFPFVWTLARAGCALAHDHIGRASSSFLAVQFPGGPRFDLGLLECAASALLAASFLLAAPVRRLVFLPALLMAGAAVRIGVWILAA
jgi:phosphatidylglycerol:prolipoprotein diacylglycerol transferase